MGHSARPKIAISGSYGGMNLGDEAILSSILAGLKRTVDADITVMTRNPEDTRRRHLVQRAVDPRTMPRAEAKLIVQVQDCMILGGGGLLYDAEADVFLREITLAREARVPSMIYAVSAGPLVSEGTCRRVKDTLAEVELVTVRDRRAKRLLEEIGVQREILVTADPALLIEPEPLGVDEIVRAEAIDPDQRLIAFSVREPGPAAPALDVEHYQALVANVADFLVDRLDAEVVFVPLERMNQDVQHSHAVIGRMRRAQKATVLKRDYSPGQLVSLLSHFEFCVGMRLHFLIFAALAGVPFVALPYASKVTGLLEELGLEVPPFERVSSGQLIAHVDRAWDNRNEQRAKLKATLPQMKERARMTGEMVVELLAHATGGGPRP